MNSSKISNILKYSFPIAGIIVLIFLGIKSRWIDFLGAFIYSIIFTALASKLNISKKLNFLAYLGIWFHLLGLIYFFNHFQYYDKIVHLIIGIFIAILLNDSLKANKINNIYLRYLLIVTITLGISGLYEIYEYTEDTLFHTHSQGVYDSVSHMILSPLDDSMFDMIISTSGALLFAIYNLILLKKNAGARIRT